MTDEKWIQWDEPREPIAMTLVVKWMDGNPCERPATLDDLRRACAAVGLDLCGCGGCDDDEPAPPEHVVRLEAGDVVNMLDEATARLTHLQAALEQSEAARADLADKLDEAQSNLAWARKCVELVLWARELKETSYDALIFLARAQKLAAKMTAPVAADVMRRDFAEHEVGKR